jgi:hypothetical protein
LSSFANLGVGLIISFIFGWKLSLVALAFIPFMVVGGFLNGYFMQGFYSRDIKALERAGSVGYFFLFSSSFIKIYFLVGFSSITEYSHCKTIVIRNAIHK